MTQSNTQTMIGICRNTAHMLDVCVKVVNGVEAAWEKLDVDLDGTELAGHKRELFEWFEQIRAVAKAPIAETVVRVATPIEFDGTGRLEGS